MPHQSRRHPLSSYPLNKRKIKSSVRFLFLRMELNVNINVVLEPPVEEFAPRCEMRVVYNKKGVRGLENGTVIFE